MKKINYLFVVVLSVCLLAACGGRYGSLSGTTWSYVQDDSVEDTEVITAMTLDFTDDTAGTLLFTFVINGDTLEQGDTPFTYSYDGTNGTLHSEDSDLPFHRDDATHFTVSNDESGFDFDMVFEMQ